MPSIEFDITTVVAIWMGGVIVLVPLMAMMARFGLAPVIDAVGRMRASGRSGGSVAEDALGERCERLEERVMELARAVARLEEANAERHAPLV